MYGSSGLRPTEVTTALSLNNPVTLLTGEEWGPVLSESAGCRNSQTLLSEIGPFSSYSPVLRLHSTVIDCVWSRPNIAA